MHVCVCVCACVCVCVCLEAHSYKSYASGRQTVTVDWTRAFTQFLSCVVQEMPMAFHVWHVRRCSMTELATMYSQMQGASTWLYKRKEWHSSELTWSIHRTHKSLDRAGKANARDLLLITHNQLISLVEFNLTQNDKCWVAGAVWEQMGCIPMGRPLNAEAADLHCAWSAYKGR